MACARDEIGEKEEEGRREGAVALGPECQMPAHLPAECMHSCRIQTKDPFPRNCPTQRRSHEVCGAAILVHSRQHRSPLRKEKIL